MQKEDQDSANTLADDSVTSVSWEASEYLQHDKDYLWLLMLIVVTALLSSLSYYLLSDVFSVAIIVLVAFTLAIYAYRKPRTLSYQINDEGLRVAERLYGYDQFSSFSIIDEGAVRSIYFEPIKRFMPPITIYYDQTNEEHVREVLANYLPYRERKLDLVDRLFKKLRF